MTCSRQRQLPLVGAMVALILLAAGCGGSSKSSTTASSTSTATSTTTSSSTTTSTSRSGNVIGRNTTVVVFPSMVVMLKKDNITMKAVPPSTVTKGVLAFPISSGQIAVATFAGTLKHSGGLIFSHGGKRVTFTEFVINTKTKQLAASVAGKSLPAFSLNLASVKRSKEPHHTIIATGIELFVTSQAASALNSGLGVKTFKSGQSFGVATTLVAVTS